VRLSAGVIAKGCPAALAVRQLSVTPSGFSAHAPSPVPAFTAAPFTRFACPHKANGPEESGTFVTSMAHEYPVPFEEGIRSPERSQATILHS
jgi:hypothetical protein